MNLSTLIRSAFFAISFLCFTAIAAESGKVEIYSAADIRKMAQELSQKQTQFASRDLSRYGTHYFMLAQREATGSAEVHEHEADIFFVEAGSADLVTGGKVVNPQTQKPGEIRGSSIQGGEKHEVATGDIIHIPAGVPHQLLIGKTKPFTYFVVKVTGQ